MTTEIVNIRFEPISAWPAINNSFLLRRNLSVLSLEARSPAQAWADVAGTVNASVWRGLEPLRLIGLGARFDAQKRLAAASARRKGPWVSLLSGERIELVPGRVLVKSRNVGNQLAAYWGMQGIRQGEEMPALEVTQRAKAVLVGGVAEDSEWADRVALRAVDLGSRNDALFIAAVESLNGVQVAARSFNSFGDPPGLDIVGDTEVLAAIRDRVGTMR